MSTAPRPPGSKARAGRASAELEERAGVGGPATPAPVLLILPDGDARVDLDAPLLGRAPGERLARAALQAGFAEVILAPGTCLRSSQFTARGAGEPVGRPGLIAFEGAYLHPGLLRLMVAHPLEGDERFTIYDAVGRPTALFTGEVETVPSAMPISEELDWPEEFGPESVARHVYAEDRARVEALVLRGEGVAELAPSLWQRRVALPLTRALTGSPRAPAQFELLALALAVGSGALALVGAWIALVAAAVALAVGVELGRVMPAVRKLRARRPATGASPPELVPEALVRPFGHASLTASLTYVLVAQTGRSSVAGLVLLAVGGAAVLLSLAQARSLLREQARVPLELPSSAGLARRLGLRIRERYRVPLVLELLTLVLALTGVAELVWGVLVAAGLARLWRWYAGPGELEAIAATARRTPFV